MVQISTIHSAKTAYISHVNQLSSYCMLTNHIQEGANVIDNLESSSLSDLSDIVEVEENIEQKTKPPLSVPDSGQTTVSVLNHGENKL